MKQLYLYFIFLILPLFSNAQIERINLFSPQGINIPLLQKTGDVRILSGLERIIFDTLNIWQNQFSWSPSPNFGVLASYSFTQKKQNHLNKLVQHHSELGFGFRKKKIYDGEMDYFQIEVYGGIGYGKSTAWSHGLKKIPGVSQRELRFDGYTGQYFYNFIQISTGFAFKNAKSKYILELIPTSRISLYNFFKIDHVSDVSTLSFELPEIWVLQMAPSFRVGYERIRLLFQAGWSIPLGTQGEDLYRQFSDFSRYGNTNFDNDLFVFVGLEYSLTVKKKK